MDVTNEGELWSNWYFNPSLFITRIQNILQQYDRRFQVRDLEVTKLTTLIASFIQAKVEMELEILDIKNGIF